ncbi:MAG: hypothetical protein Q4G24_10615 [Paracoccus sp. (in: a-proteobacteria)]|uniref:hypothetical protein n=1 Tax=Paracoccus sp. TaxID=267 RepID=UPI0026E0BB97|nr:hypothetical protein [Paracoccus sp. (in: a-proteobacteria)]MDO5621910.1 hypothetical protein [Paracoccus sp. (in: a-proteobacteria)]
MRLTASALTAHRNQRRGVHTEHLVWIEARNRQTDQIETAGLWTGSGTRQFTTDGVVRMYHGTSILSLPTVFSEAGVQVRRAELALMGVSDAVVQAVRVYDTQNAPILIHRAEFDADQNLIAPPERVFRGRIETAPITTAAFGDGLDVSLGLVSDAWRLTVIPPLTKSAPMQQLRGGDQGRRYSNVHDASVTWGESQQQPKKRKKFLGIF